MCVLSSKGLPALHVEELTFLAPHSSWGSAPSLVRWQPLGRKALPSVQSQIPSSLLSPWCYCNFSHYVDQASLVSQIHLLSAGLTTWAVTMTISSFLNVSFSFLFTFPQCLSSLLDDASVFIYLNSPDWMSLNVYNRTAAWGWVDREQCF